MVGEIEECSIEARDGPSFRKYANAAAPALVSGFTAARYRAASCGGTMFASCVKYLVVVSLSRTGGCHVVTAVIAAAR